MFGNSAAMATATPPVIEDSSTAGASRSSERRLATSAAPNDHPQQPHRGERPVPPVAGVQQIRIVREEHLRHVVHGREQHRRRDRRDRDQQHPVAPDEREPAPCLVLLPASLRHLFGETANLERCGGRRDHQERDGVKQQGSSGSPVGAERSGQPARDQRTGDHPDVANGLHGRVRLGQVLFVHGGGDDGEHRRGRDRGRGAEEERQHDDQPHGFGERQADGDERLRNGGERQRAGRLRPVDDQARERCEHHQRDDAGEQDGSDRDAGTVAELEDLDRQRYQRELVPERRKSVGQRQQTEVGRSQQPHGRIVTGARFRCIARTGENERPTFRGTQQPGSTQDGRGPMGTPIR